jgi:hypothetical protein
MSDTFPLSDAIVLMVSEMQKQGKIKPDVFVESFRVKPEPNDAGGKSITIRLSDGSECYMETAAPENNRGDSPIH